MSSSVVEDSEEAFVKNPDGCPLVLYLRTAEDHPLTGSTRQLLERVNAADKAAKVKVCVCVYFWSNVADVQAHNSPDSLTSAGHTQPFCTYCTMIASCVHCT